MPPETLTSAAEQGPPNSRVRVEVRKVTSAETTGGSRLEVRVSGDSWGSVNGPTVWQGRRHGFALGEEEWPPLRAFTPQAGVGKAGGVKGAGVKGRKAPRKETGASSLTVLASNDFAVAIDTHENLKLTIAMQKKGAPVQSPSVLVHNEEEIDLSGTFFVRLFDAECAEFGRGHVIEYSTEPGSTVYNMADGRVFTGYFYPQVSFHNFKLGSEATRICREPNAGGQSTVSEVGHFYFALLCMDPG